MIKENEVYETRNGTIVTFHYEQIDNSKYKLLKGIYKKDGKVQENIWASNGKFSNATDKNNNPIEFGLDVIKKV